MEVSGRHCAKYASHKRTNTARFQLHKVPKVIESIEMGTSLAVQWLGLLTSTAGAHFQSLVGELRSYMLAGVPTCPHRPASTPTKIIEIESREMVSKG